MVPAPEKNFEEGGDQFFRFCDVANSGEDDEEEEKKKKPEKDTSTFSDPFFICAVLIEVTKLMRSNLEAKTHTNKKLQSHKRSVLPSIM